MCTADGSVCRKVSVKEMSVKFGTMALKQEIKWGKKSYLLLVAHGTPLQWISDVSKSKYPVWLFLWGTYGEKKGGSRWTHLHLCFARLQNVHYIKIYFNRTKQCTQFTLVHMFIYCLDFYFYNLFWIFIINKCLKLL